MLQNIFAHFKSFLFYVETRFASFY